MNIEDLISQYIDGELSTEAEAELHHRLSVSPEDRLLFREQILLRAAARDARVLHQPTVKARNDLFDRLRREEGMSERVVPPIVEASARPVEDASPVPSVPVMASVPAAAPLSAQSPSHPSDRLDAAPVRRDARPEERRRRRRIVPVLVIAMLGVISGGLLWQNGGLPPRHTDMIVEGGTSPENTSASPSPTSDERVASAPESETAASSSGEMSTAAANGPVADASTSSSGSGAGGEYKEKSGPIPSGEHPASDFGRFEGRLAESSPSVMDGAGSDGSGMGRAEDDRSPVVPDIVGGAVSITAPPSSPKGEEMMASAPLDMESRSKDVTPRAKRDQVAAKSAAPTRPDRRGGGYDGDGAMARESLSSDTVGSRRTPVTTSLMSSRGSGTKSAEAKSDMVAQAETTSPSEPSAPPPPPAAAPMKMQPPLMAMDSTAARDEVRVERYEATSHTLDAAHPSTRGFRVLANLQQSFFFPADKGARGEQGVRVGGEIGGNHQVYALVGRSGYSVTNTTVVQRSVLGMQSDTVYIGRVPGVSNGVQGQDFEVINREGVVAQTAQEQIAETVDNSEIWAGLGYRYSMRIGSKLRMGAGAWAGMNARGVRGGVEAPISYELSDRVRLEGQLVLQYARPTGETTTTTVANSFDATKNERLDTHSTSQVADAEEVTPGVGVGITVLLY